MSNKKDCIVIIPVYKSLDDNDKLVVKQAIKMTKGTDLVFIMPNGFVRDESFAEFNHLSEIRFEDKYFTNIFGYNRLMLDTVFYSRFRNFKYILIHQTDAYLFKPELKKWIDTNYDYIGAPWLHPQKIKKGKYHTLLLKICPWIFSHKRRRQIRHYNNVGNGGLSLRKIDTFIKILESKDSQRILNYYLNKQLSGFSSYNEDVFWSLEGPRLFKDFKKPKWQEAIFFSLEKDAPYAYNIMGEQLPFGCHAPLKIEYDFWKEHLPLKKPQ